MKMIQFNPSELLDLEPRCFERELLDVLAASFGASRRFVISALCDFVRGSPERERRFRWLLANMSLAASRELVSVLVSKPDDRIVWPTRQSCIRTTTTKLFDWVTGRRDRLVGDDLPRVEVQRAIVMLRERPWPTQGSRARDASRADEVRIPIARVAPSFSICGEEGSNVWSSCLFVTPAGAETSRVHGGVRLEVPTAGLHRIGRLRQIVVVLVSVGSRICFPANLVPDGRGSLLGEIDVVIPHRFKPMKLDRNLMRSLVIDVAANRGMNGLIKRSAEPSDSRKPVAARHRWAPTAR